MADSEAIVKKAIPYFFDYTMGPMLSGYVASRIRGSSDVDADLNQVVTQSYSFKFLCLRLQPNQVRSEVTELLSRLRNAEPRCCVEIGTAAGGTLLLLAKASGPDATIISVDLPGGKYGLGYPSWRIPLYKSFARDSQKVILIQGDSHDGNTVDSVERVLRGKPIDFLFIDGDHSYEGVRRDFKLYTSMVRKGGIVGIHDIVPHPHREIGVPRFWNEVRHRHNSIEIVESWQQNGAGIGLLWL